MHLMLNMIGYGSAVIMFIPLILLLIIVFTFVKSEKKKRDRLLQIEQKLDQIIKQDHRLKKPS
ncbi:hypothetical protein [Fictibacillus sp. NRS-1165]|uniref:hypothetical protein n=1 Tax=Fictibacillus sp. NRS-1165 TaxID=3144463 RepID=UPI003D26386A